jgi:hypothetical protein
VKEMSSKFSYRKNRKGQVQVEKAVNKLNIVSQVANRKEADEPIYLARYDD